MSRVPYRIAGIESFQQSGLKISLHNFLARWMNEDSCQDTFDSRSLGVKGGGATEELTSTRVYAMISEMVPFRISFIRTAVAAEYVREDGVDTLE